MNYNVSPSAGIEGASLAKWIVCQIGAREHYAIARTLHASGNLSALITDAWLKASPLANFFPSPLRGRFHADLKDAKVLAPTVRSVAAHIMRSCGVHQNFDFLRRNRRFQDQAEAFLRALDLDDRTILFSYSYAAKRLFQHAKRRGWRTVLGQIDPGPEEERIVGSLVKATRHVNPNWQPADPNYWRHWQDEVRLADRIIVNSEWSRLALLKAAVPAHKIRIIPLSYSASEKASAFQRTYPDRFTLERPLRVLFLGQVNLRKGAHIVIDACRAMQHLPVEFRMVGPLQIERPPDLNRLRALRWTGTVSRDQVDEHYQTADVFLLPSFSDGFALTQLEAQAWKLPIISSYACGDVVIDGINGRRLVDPTWQAVVETLTEFCARPDLLRRMSAQSYVRPQFRMQAIGAELQQVGREMLAEAGR